MRMLPAQNLLNIAQQTVPSARLITNTITLMDSYNAGMGAQQEQLLLIYNLLINAKQLLIALNIREHPVLIPCMWDNRF